MDCVFEGIRICRNCGLWKDANNPVPGEGSLDASVMLIGEAPGEREDLTGRPFVGRAGALLDKLLAGIGLARSEVFIANVVKHRPPGNRDPTGEEIRACSPYLYEQISIIEPDIIVPLGRHATEFVLSHVPGSFGKITDIRGRIIQADIFGHDVRIIPTIHPAAALYNPAYREGLLEDFQTIQNELAKMPARERRT
jgi:uracil-DNA glycosylase